MTYVADRVVFDADSHIMEPLDWLETYADPSIRERLKPLGLELAGDLGKAAETLTTPPERSGDLLADVLGHKGWKAVGANDPAARSEALDALGYGQQLVFSTFSSTQFNDLRDPDLLYGGSTAHNRGMADFCAHDPRLVAVGYVPLEDPERALRSAQEAIELGCGAILVSTRPPDSHSPSHPVLDPVWATIQEAGLPVVLHVGFGPRALRKAFNANGRPRPTSFLGDGENIRAKDYIALHQAPETFLSCLILDGHLERFPDLRWGVIELGAGWVVPLLGRLDSAQHMFAKTEPDIRALSMRASDYIRRQVRFTPFVHEPVAWLIELCGPELFMFSSDYPHPEGGRDPLSRFSGSLEGIDGQARAAFFAGNYLDLMGLDSTVAR
jgi:uncharacterized protein